MIVYYNIYKEEPFQKCCKFIDLKNNLFTNSCKKSHVRELFKVVKKYGKIVILSKYKLGLELAKEIVNEKNR